MDTVKAGFLGGTLQIVFDMASPTKAEIESVCSKNPLKIAYTVVDSVLFFCIKPNDMDYQDAPFTPHFFDPEPFYIDPPATGFGYSCILTIRDNARGTLVEKGNRLIGLSHDFSVALYEDILKLYKAPFHMDSFSRSVNKTYSFLSSKDLFAQCKHVYTTGENEHTAESEEKMSFLDILRKTFPENPDFSHEKIPDDISVDDLIRTRGEYVADAESICVFCIPNQFKDEAKDFPSDYLVPIPQKYLREKGFTVEDGYVYVEVEYNMNYGVVIPDKYYD